jgi:hypothetical protein
MGSRLRFLLVLLAGVGESSVVCTAKGEPLARPAASGISCVLVAGDAVAAGDKASGISCVLVAGDAVAAGDKDAAASWLGRACEQSCGIWCPSLADRDTLLDKYGPAGIREVEQWRRRCDRGEGKRCLAPSED